MTTKTICSPHDWLTPGLFQQEIACRKCGTIRDAHKLQHVRSIFDSYRRRHSAAESDLFEQAFSQASLLALRRDVHGKNCFIHRNLEFACCPGDSVELANVRGELQSLHCKDCDAYVYRRLLEPCLV